MFFQKKQINRKTSKRPKLYRMSHSFLDRVKLISGVVVVVSVCWGLYQLVVVSQFCRLATVQVVGRTAHLSEDDIEKLAQIPFGENLLFVNLHQIEASIRRYSWVKEVHVKRNFPHGITLHVEEYVPSAIIDAKNLADSNFYYVSQEGKIFKKLSFEDDRNFPMITGFTKDHLKKYPHYFRGKIKEAFEFFKKFQEQTENSNLGLVEVHTSVADGVTLVTSSPPMRLYFGQNKIQEKLERWNEFLKMMNDSRQFYRSVDLHVDGKIFARN